MISRDTFIETMCALENLEEKMYTVEDALKVLFPDLSGFYIEDAFKIVLTLFKKIFNDEDSVLDFFVNECDFLNVPTYNEHGHQITSWGEVYDILIKNMEE